MIVEVVSVEGFPDWLLAGPARRVQDFRAAVRRADKIAMMEWADRANPGLHDRFNLAGGRRLNLAARSPKYDKIKRRRWGGALPYVSPKTNHIKLRDLMQLPGSSRVQSKNGVAQVESRLRLPGARVLNAAQRWNPAYRTQFVGAGRAEFHLDALWINGRRSQILTEWAKNKMTGKRRGRPRKV